MINGFNELSYFFPEKYRTKWEKWNLGISELEEIRIRVNKHVRIYSGKQIKTDIVYGEKELEEIFRYFCRDSIYAYEEERKKGYMTLKGGHRVGIAGEFVVGDDGRYIVKYIRYINIRVAHEIKNIATNILRHLYDQDKDLLNTLIISPPGIGKTTLLRDLIRLISNGVGGYKEYNVGLVDERGEIAGAHRGSAMLDCGECTDVVTGIDKYNGINILLRAFAPQVIAIDEIGAENDAKAIFNAGISGCKIIATIHGKNCSDVFSKIELKELTNKAIFQRYIIIYKDDKLERMGDIYDSKGVFLCSEGLQRQ